MFTSGYISKSGENRNSKAAIFFQPKLAINQPNDVYEQEADAVADKAMQTPDHLLSPNAFFQPAISPIQRKCKECEDEEEKGKMQRKETNSNTVDTNSSIGNYINSLDGKGRLLNQSERSFFEPRLGYNLSNVELHTDTEANQSAKSINALAYTHGNHIVFGANQYQSDTESGKRLIAHELTHVVQQSRSANNEWIHRKFDFTRPTPQKSINPISVKYFQDTGSRDQDKISLGLTTSTVNGSLTSTVGDIKRLLDLQLTGTENPPGTFNCRAFSNGSVPVSARELILTAPNAQGNWTGAFRNYPEQTCTGKTNIPVTIKGDPDAATIEQRVLSNENEHVSDIQQACTDLNAQLDAMSRINGSGNSEAACAADLIRKIGKGPDPANAIGMAFRNRVIADSNRRDSSGSHTLNARRRMVLDCASLIFIYKV